MKKGMGKSKNKIMVLTIGGIAAAIAVIGVIGSRSPKKEIIPTVETVSVEKGNLTQEVDASGTVESDKKKTFFSPVNGEIQTMNVQVGDTVETGQGIIGFNLEDLEKENQKAEMNVRSGQLELQDAQQQANAAQAKIDEAWAKIPELEAKITEKENRIADLKQQIASAQTNAVKDAQAQAEQAQKEAAAAYAEAEAEYQTKLTEAENKMYECQRAFNQAKEKYEKGEIPVETYSDAEIKFQKAQQDYEDVKNSAPEKNDYTVSMDTSGAAADTWELEAQMETASGELAQLQSELASQKAITEADAGGLTSAAQNRMQISNNLAELEAKTLQELLAEGRKGIQAEFKGVISDAKVTQGSQVSQGMELFTIQSLEEVSVNANISKYDFDKVKEGQKAEVTLGDSRYEGTVTKISKIAIPNEKGTPMIGITVHIENPDDQIFIGVEAKVSICSAEANNVQMLPVEVVNIGKEGSFCYVIKDGRIQKQNIETGISSDSYVEIKSGLSESDQILKEIGSYEEGDQVNPREASDAE